MAFADDAGSTGGTTIIVTPGDPLPLDPLRADIALLSARLSNVEGTLLTVGEQTDLLIEYGAPPTDTPPDPRTFYVQELTLHLGTQQLWPWVEPATPEAPAIAGTATIEGDLDIGDTLTITHGAVTGTPTPTVTYRWTVDGVAVANTLATYVIAVGEGGKSYVGAVDATNSEATTSQTTAAVVINAPAATAFPTSWPDGLPTITQIVGSPTGRLQITIPDASEFDDFPEFDFYLTTPAASEYPLPDSNAAVVNASSLMAAELVMERPPKATGTVIRPAIYVRRRSDGVMHLLYQHATTITITGVVAPPTSNSVTITNMAALRQALIDATPGRIIKITGGTKTDVSTITLGTANVNKTNVVIEAENLDNMPILTGHMAINWTGVSGVTFQHLTFRPAGRDSAGFATGRCMRINRCSQMIVEDCLFDTFFGGIEAQYGDRNRFQYNTMRGQGGDALQLYGYQRQTYTGYNAIVSPIIDQARANDAGRHPDFQQWAVHPNMPLDSENERGAHDCLTEYNLFSNDIPKIYLQASLLGAEVLRTSSPFPLNGHVRSDRDRHKRNLWFNNDYLMSYTMVMGLNADFDTTFRRNRVRYTPPKAGWPSNPLPPAGVWNPTVWIQSCSAEWYPRRLIIDNNTFPLVAYTNLPAAGTSFRMPTSEITNTNNQLGTVGNGYGVNLVPTSYTQLNYGAANSIVGQFANR